LSNTESPAAEAESNPGHAPALEGDPSPAVDGGKLDTPVRREGNRPDYIYHRLLAVSDVAAIIVAGLAAYLAADLLGRGADSLAYLEAMAVMVPIWLLVAYFAGLYHQVDYRIGQDLVDELGSVLVAVTAWAWFFVVVRSLLSDSIADMTRAILMWVFVAFMLLAFRAALRSWTRHQKWNRRSVAVVGDPEDAAALVGRIDRHPEWCLDIRAQIQSDPDNPAMYLILDCDGELKPAGEEGMIGHLRSRGIDRAIVVGASESLSARSGLIRKLANEGIAIDHVVGGPETLYSTAFPQHLEGLTMMSMRPSKQPPVSNALKRTLDVGLSALLLLLALPVLGISALAIKVGSSGPVFFRQARSGKNGETFHVLKLRTMTKDADSERDALRASHPGLGQGEMFKLPDDPRVTPVGKRLRRWSIDEIPQFWNVLIGDMSLVGPRPLPLDEAPLVVDEFKLRERVRPGMTGPWQVMGRSDIPAEDMLRLDYTYVIGWTFAEDLKLLMRTATAVLGGRGVS
jgi:exopolysaccharide biosynthesis polyprenyl glycosylphosphotransferase